MKPWAQMSRSERELAILPLSGKSASQIGELLGASKNAIISFVRRYAVPHEWGGNAAAKAEPTLSEQEEADKLAAVAVKLAASAAWEPLPGTTPARLHEIAPRGCSWPVWRHDNEPKLFCNAIVSDRNKPYCPVHDKRAYPVRRNA